MSRRAPTVESLTTSLNYARRQRAFAWAKYYETTNATLVNDRAVFTRVERVIESEMPEHIKSELKTMATQLRKKWECPICLDTIEDNDLEITSCGHFYCKACLLQHVESEKGRGKPKWECCVCRRKHGYKADDSE